jgi:hypothetical protein
MTVDSANTVTIASGLVGALSDPLRGSDLIRDLNGLLGPSGLMIAHKLLNADDLAYRLQISGPHAKVLLNKHADVQCGRYWRMTEQRYSECVRKGRF